MATAAPPRRRRPLIPNLSGRKRSKSRKTIVAGAIIAFAALVAFAPTIASKTSLPRNKVAALFEGMDGTVTVESCSLGWFSPIELGGVEIKDADGRRVVYAPKVRGTQAALALMAGSKSGTWTLQRPEVEVTLADDGSNIERVFGPWLEADRDDSSTDVRVEVVEGIVTVSETGDGRRRRIEDVNLDLELAAEEPRPLRLTVEGVLPSELREGRFQAELKMDGLGLPGDPDTPPGRLGVKTQSFPIHAVRPLLRRFAAGTDVSGRLTSDMELRWGGSELRDLGTVFRGNLDAEDLSITSDALGAEPLRLEQVELPCRVAWKDGGVEIQEFALDSDLGQVELTGRVERYDDLVQALSDGVYELQGKLDIARLASVLPETLQLHPGTQVESGTIDFDLASQPLRGGWKWSGHFEASDVKARRGGEVLVWREPILLEFEANHDLEKGPTVEKLICTSEFLQLQAEGTPQHFAVAASYDLGRLSLQLRRFVDLGGAKLSGDGWTYVSWERMPDGSIATDGEVQVRDFELLSPQQRPWREENMIVLLEAKGAAQGFEVTRVDMANLKVESGPDQVRAELKAPVRDFGGAWPLQLELNGELARWLTRVEPWIAALNEWDVSGKARAVVTATVSEQRIDVSRAQVLVQPLELAGRGLAVREPSVEIEGAADWDVLGDRLRVKEARLIASALTMETEDLLVDASNDSSTPLVTGLLAFAGDLRRLDGWLPRDPQNPRTWHAEGNLQGQARFRRRMSGMDVGLEADVDELVIVQAGQTPWTQGRVTLVAEGTFDELADQLRLQKLDLATDGLRINGSGKVADFGGRRDLTLDGQMQYDFSRLGPILLTAVGDDLALEGTGSRPFHVEVPLARVADAEKPADWLRDVRASTEVGWSAARIYNIPAGAGYVRAELADGLVRCSTIDTAFSGGRLVMQPQLLLAPPPTEVIIQTGTVLQDVAITPEMVDRGLKYITPALSGVTETRGRFSLAFDQFRMKPQQPEAGQLSGWLNVHSMEIGIGSAPLVRELALLLGYQRPAKLQRESVVEFAMADGRIHHRGFELVFDEEFTVRTSGSVGIDKTLQVTAEMPVPPRLLAQIPDRRVRAALAGRTIQLPVTGTLNDPRIDRRALDQIGASLVRDATGDAIRDTIERETDRFFRNLFGSPQ